MTGPERSDVVEITGEARGAEAVTHSPLPRWTRLLPSLGDLLLIGALGLFVKLPLYDTDLWWHLATGQWILANRAVPRVDFFSFTAAGRPWIAHEWLAEVAMAVVWRLAGIEGMALAQALLLALTLAVLYRHLSADGVPGLATAPVLAWALVVMLPAAHPRPYLFTLLALAVLALWLRDGVPRRSTFVLVPLLFLLWANVHGGFVFGLGWLGLVVLGEWWATRRVPRALLVLLGLSVVAVTVNPNGLALLTYPLQYGAGSVHYQLIAEWASPDFHLAFNWIVELYLLAAVAAVLLRRAPGWRRDLLLVFAFGHLALLSVRNIPLLAVVAAPVIARALTAALPVRLRVTDAEPLVPAVPASTMPGRMTQKLRTVLVVDRWHHSLVWFAVVAIWVALGPWRGSPPGAIGEEVERIHGTHFGSPNIWRTWIAPLSPTNWDPARSPRTDDLPFPYVAADRLLDHPLEGHLLNDYGWGGYLIWKLAPDVPVFIDGRADVYGETILEDYATMIGLRPGWREDLDRYGITHVLLRAEAPLAQALRHACGWVVRYEDERSVLLSRPAGGVCPGGGR